MDGLAEADPIENSIVLRPAAPQEDRGQMASDGWHEIFVQLRNAVVSVLAASLSAVVLKCIWHTDVAVGQA